MKCSFLQEFVHWEKGPFAVGMGVSAPLHHTLLAWVERPLGRSSQPGCPNVCHEKVFSRQRVPFWPIADYALWMSRSPCTTFVKWGAPWTLPAPSLACPMAGFLPSWEEVKPETWELLLEYFTVCKIDKDHFCFCQNASVKLDFPTVILMKTISQKALKSSLYCAVK